MKKSVSEPMPAHLARELEKVSAMADEDIDYSDAPSIADWSGAVRGKYANGAAVPLQRIALPEQIANIYRAVEQLEQKYAKYKRKFTPDGHLVGSIGEVIAAEAFGLKLHATSHPLHDAEDKDGRNVQIKLTAGNRIAMYGEPERLLVMKIVSPEWAEVVYYGPGEPAWGGDRKKAKNGQRVTTLSALRKLALAAAG